MRPTRRSLVIRYAVIAIGVVAAVAPLLWMLGKSVGTSSEVFDPPLGLVPESLSLAAYDAVVGTVPFHLYALNSIAAGLASGVISILLCAPAGFGFARYRFRGRGLAFMTVLATMMIPVTVIAIPLYLQTRSLGWVNTYAGLIIPTALWPLGVYVMRQAFRGIEDAYFEAARLDGASELQIFLRIAVPQVRTPIIVVGLYAFLQSWNNYLWPLIVVQRDEMRTIPTGLDAFQATVFGNYEQLLAAGVLASLPTLLLFAFLQRYFVQATFASGVKG